MDHPLYKNSLEALFSLIEKNFEEHYMPEPLDPPDVIASKSRIKKKEIEKAAESYKESLTRGFEVLVKVWCDKKKSGQFPL